MRTCCIVQGPLLSALYNLNEKEIKKEKTKIMASGPTTPWQTDGETMETVTDFTFLGSKITADGDCKEIKPVNHKGLFTERTDTEAPILWPLNVKS